MTFAIEYWHWIVAGLILIGSEMLVPAFFLLWIGLSAVLTGVCLLLFDISVATQLGLWAGLSIVSLFAWFKLIQPHFKNRSQSGMLREAVIGQQGLVLSYNPETQQGKVRFTVPVAGSDEWSIRSLEPLKAGDRVCVKEFSGNDLLVTPLTSTSTPTSN
jgi:membrane protein implicated in regulation of membrane protease activity